MQNNRNNTDRNGNRNAVDRNADRNAQNSVEFDRKEAHRLRTLNPANQWITKEHLNKIFSKLGIEGVKIGNISSYYPAFVHQSYMFPDLEILRDQTPLSKTELESISKLNLDSVSIPLQSKSYERLEYLGDSFLGSAITYYIYTRYPEEKYPLQAEGFLTKFRTKLVRGTCLSILSKKLKLDRYVLVSRQYQGVPITNEVMEDVLEALIGAMLLDLETTMGYGNAVEIIRAFVINLIERYLDVALIARRDDNYKDILLKYYHKYFEGANPRYVEISTDGPSNNRTFKAGVLNPFGDIIATGEGTKITFAEQEAAKEALKYYKQDVYSDSEEPEKELYSDSESEEL